MSVDRYKLPTVPTPVDTEDIANKAYVDAAAGQDNTASNVGGGTGEIFKQKTGIDLEFKTINGGVGIVITDGVSTITIDISGLTASRALETDGTGKLIASAITAAELAKLAGATKFVKDMAFIQEADLSGGVNQVIEITSGLEDYDEILLVFNLKLSTGTFVPQLQLYNAAGLINTGVYGTNSIANGVSTKTGSASVVDIDGGITALSVCRGYAIIHTKSAGTFPISIEGKNIMMTALGAVAPDAIDFFAYVNSATDVEGVRLVNNGASTPTFTTDSRIAVFGLKKV